MGFQTLTIFFQKLFDHLNSISYTLADCEKWSTTLSIILYLNMYQILDWSLRSCHLIRTYWGFISRKIANWAHKDTLTCTSSKFCPSIKLLSFGYSLVLFHLIPFAKEAFMDNNHNDNRTRLCHRDFLALYNIVYKYLWIHRSLRQPSGLYAPATARAS